MATQDGLEPTISAVTGRHSNQLNYWAVVMSIFSGAIDLIIILHGFRNVKEFRAVPCAAAPQLPCIP